MATKETIAHRATIQLEFFSSNLCTRCQAAKKRLHSVLDELGDDRIQYRELDVVEALDYAVSLGILTTPAIVINGQLVLSNVPGKIQLKNILLPYLEV